MARLPETKWNTIRGAQGTRKVGEPLPVIREYEENGHIIKVYAAATSVDLLGEHGVSANPAPPKLIYPAS